MKNAKPLVADKAAELAKVLPHPSDLNYNQQLLEVDQYDAQNDTFTCIVHTAAPCEGQTFELPACLLPKLTGEYGEPLEMVLRTFLVENHFGNLIDKARVMGWEETPAGIHHADIDITMPNWEQAIASCIEVASE